MMRTGVGRKLAIALAVASVISGIATYAALTGTPPFGGNTQNVFILLNIDLVLLLLLGAIVTVRLVRLWLERRRGSAGSRLHTRMVALFSLTAVAPSIVVVIFSALFLNFGLQAWFSKQVSTALEQSLVVAEAYVEEHRKSIRADALSMAADLNRQVPYIARNPSRFSQVVERLADLRSLAEAAVVHRNGRIIARDALSLSLELERLPESALQRAADGEVVILSDRTQNRVRALIRLDGFVDAYLLVGRFIEARVIVHMQRVQGAVGSYRELENRKSGIQVTFVLIFVVVALLVLLASVWMGLYFANRLARPIGELIVAAERVRKGDLDARVVEGDPGDEIGTLSRAFNRMTDQLNAQRRELVDTNEQLDERRRFTEAVLSGVSAGVIGLDEDGRITLPNPSALRLLDEEETNLVGRILDEAVPEMRDMLRMIRERPNRPVDQQLEIERRERRRTLVARMAAEISGDSVIGYVVTFDDITALVSAQRTAAWGDVARRIAHEIKNPLTPIQLAAERLKRRYLGEVKSEPDVFAACTDTIVRHVGDIRQMVDEFSEFARMPAPSMIDADLRDLVHQAVLLQRVARPDLDIIMSPPEGPVLAHCDGRQIGQALTNLLKNAVEAIEGRPPPADGTDLPKGRIEVSIARVGPRIQLRVQDNGRGLPRENRDRLIEPYVTSRARGTGLGLAIVAKIMEDHGGELILEDRDGGGAQISLVLTPEGPDEGHSSQPVKI